MIINAKSLIGKIILTSNNAKDIGEVKDIVYNSNEKKISALIVDKAGWISNAKIIPYDKITSVGEDAVIVTSEDVIVSSDEAPESIRNTINQKNYLTKTNVMTTNGTELGKVNDIVINSDTGEAQEIIISQGIKDIQSGKKHISMTEVSRIGEGVIFVNPQVKQTIEKQAEEQGVQGAVNKATEKVQEAKNNPENQQKVQKGTQRVKEAGQNVLEKIDEGAHVLAHEIGQKYGQAKQSIKDTQRSNEKDAKEHSIGKYITVNLLSPNDEIIAKRGDMITHEIMDRAEEHGLGDIVINNTSEVPI